MIRGNYLEFAMILYFVQEDPKVYNFITYCLYKHTQLGISEEHRIEGLKSIGC